MRSQRRSVREVERDNRPAPAAIGDKRVDVPGIRVERDPRLAGHRGPAIEIGPEPCAVVHEFPASRLGRVGDRFEGPERPQHAVKSRQRKAPRQQEVAALRQRLSTRIRCDVRVRQRGAVDVLRVLHVDRADDRTHGCELARHAGVKIGGTRKGLLHGVVNGCRHFECRRHTAVGAAAVGGNRLERRDVGRRWLDCDDDNRHAFGHAARANRQERRRRRGRVVSRGIRRVAAVLAAGDEHDDRVAARAVGRRVRRHRRDSRRLRIHQGVGQRPILKADARHAGGNQPRVIVGPTCKGGGHRARGVRRGRHHNRARGGHSLCVVGRGDAGGIDCVVAVEQEAGVARSRVLTRKLRRVGHEDGLVAVRPRPPGRRVLP